MVDQNLTLQIIGNRHAVDDKGTLAGDDRHSGNRFFAASGGGETVLFHVPRTYFNFNTSGFCA